jgi:hypothetical protein
MDEQDWAGICPGCFAAKGTARVCPHCGYDEAQRRSPLALPHRTLLHGQYRVGRVVGKPGGFGVTYLAWDQTLATRVAIKEYLPRELAARESGASTVMAHSEEDAVLFREGLGQFLGEARTLAQLDHANVVRVRYFFEENATGYLVMDYYDGLPLEDYLQQQGGTLSEALAVHLLAAARYVERHPGRARLCATPQDWPGSSARAHLAGEDDSRVSVRPLLELLPPGDAFVGQTDAADFGERLRAPARPGRPLGPDSFVESLERRLRRSLKRRKPGPQPPANGTAKLVTCSRIGRKIE